jgi:hypothetical protein
MLRFLRRLFYRCVPVYVRLELRCAAYSEAEALLSDNEGKPESERWTIAAEEDSNRALGLVWLERRVRITE